MLIKEIEKLVTKINVFGHQLTHSTNIVFHHNHHQLEAFPKICQTRGLEQPPSTESNRNKSSGSSLPLEKSGCRSYRASFMAYPLPL